MPSSVRTPRSFIGAVPDEWQLYSDNASDYTIGPSIGFGASSIVYQAEFRPPDAPQSIPCALKVLDLDRLPQHPLRLLQRETQLMSLSKHPNVLRVRGTWMTGHKLYIALRLMNAGSAADVMHYGWPGGMEEEVVRCILKQALEGINYLHINGFIHRDVKAANLLIDDDGTVLLGDLGVAAFLGDNEDTTAQKPNGRPGAIGKRKSFVGTPCWMAPEVINRKQYDASADIWSFGITALELAQGRAPRSREPPHSVLLHIVTNTPPTLDREAGPHKYSRAFQEMVERCLNKDPSQRPTAAELLQTPFFKAAKKKGYLVNTILKGLPPLAKRQERRKQPSIISPRTLDSWDFSGTSSPTTSVYGPPAYRHRPLDFPLALYEFEGENGENRDGTSENRGRDEGALVDAEQEHDSGRQITPQHAPRPHSAAPSPHPHSRDHSHHSTSRTHSRGVSWADDREASGGVGGSGSVVQAESVSVGSVAESAAERKSAPLSSGAIDIPYPSPSPNPADITPAATQDATPTTTQPIPVPVPPSTRGASDDSSPSPSGSKISGWRRLIGSDGSPEDSLRKKMFGGVLAGGKRLSSSFGSD
ncbi:kinase-like protein [Cristinia sonorae]|uniref:Kinase-like protein n=1 Tax=Cristinia sonorae TaxID=1940300 RepID=A0A8K0XLN1_9AGAR|nr:kinase-like protein [Cristinia sonorae]